MDQDATWCGGGLVTGHIVLDGDPAPTTERGIVRLCGFHRISTFGYRVRTSWASFIAFLQSLAPDIASLDRFRRV